jgi:hypothetical protein
MFTIVDKGTRDVRDIAQGRIHAALYYLAWGVR